MIIASTGDDEECSCSLIEVLLKCCARRGMGSRMILLIWYLGGCSVKCRLWSFWNRMEGRVISKHHWAIFDGTFSFRPRIVVEFVYLPRQGKHFGAGALMISIFVCVCVCGLLLGSLQWKADGTCTWRWIRLSWNGGVHGTWTTDLLVEDQTFA